MRDTSQQGLVSHTAILNRLVQLGFEVLLPWADHLGYDLAYYAVEEHRSFGLFVHREGQLVRIQCKTGRLEKGGTYFAFNTVSYLERFVQCLKKNNLIYPYGAGRSISAMVNRAPQQKISRRTAIVGLSSIVGVAMIGGGITALWYRSQGLVSHSSSPPMGTILYTYMGHSDEVYSVAWSPDGKRIVSCSVDKTVQVWDATGGGNLFAYYGHSDWVSSVAWSPDGKRIASGAWDKTVQVWQAL